jgi:hypothetical protein
VARGRVFGDGSGQSQGTRSGEWHQMDLVMVFLALCLIAWMRGKLTARPLSFGQWPAGLAR